MKEKDHKDFIKGIKFYWSKCDFSPCVWRLEAVHFDCPYPIGYMFIYRLATTKPKENKAYSISLILETYVLPCYRRRGVSTALTKEVSSCSSFLLTGFGTKLGNLFMKNQKFLEVPFGLYKEVK
jgi:hypothetical protein